MGIRRQSWLILQELTGDYEALDFAQPELNAFGELWREKAAATRVDFFTLVRGEDQ